MERPRLSVDSQLVRQALSRAGGANIHKVASLTQSYMFAADLCHALPAAVDEPVNWYDQAMATERRLRIFIATGVMN